MNDSAGEWNGQAATFDDATDHSLLDPQVRMAWQRLLKAALPSPPAVIADLGCGTGTLSVLLAGVGHKLTGVDFSTAMIDLAIAKAAVSDTKVDFVVGDAADPPLPPSTFDVVLSRHVLWAMPDPAAALARWVQLLKPDGRLVLIEGQWSTGAGLTAQRTAAMVRKLRANVTIQPLTDPRLWGRTIDDERYLLLSPS